MEQSDNFSGNWLLEHWYPSVDDTAEKKSEHQLVAHQRGSNVVLQTAHRTEKDSYMLVRLRIEDGIVTGMWHENAMPDGPYKGVQYSGTGQLLISEDGQTMEGLWVGAGIDRSANKPKIYTGRWRLTRDQQKQQ